MIFFEFHLTLSDFPLASVKHLESFCEKHKAKALWIELERGDSPQQPMLNKVITAENFDIALNEAKQLTTLLNEEVHPVNRVKIEIPFVSLEAYHQSSANAPVLYHEWHGKIDLNNKEELLEVCLKHKAHLSRNALKNQQNLRFVTLRTYAAASDFRHRVLQLQTDLRHGNWPLLKEQYETCVYDSKVALDNGWLQA